MNDLMRGAVLAVLTISVSLLLPGDLVIPFFAFLLVFAAAVYVGFAEADPTENEKGIQWGVALAFVAIALLGLRTSPWVIASGWVLHSGWDLLHHRDVLKTRTAEWYPGACLAYDLIIAGFIGLWTVWLG